jgi:hypothetical protein
MLFAFLSTNEHGRSLIALIRAIRACPACFPELYITCDNHRAKLDALYPEPCPDPGCPACTPTDRHDITTYGDRANGWERVELVYAPGHTPRVERTPAVHDNGDYRDPKAGQTNGDNGGDHHV